MPTVTPDQGLSLPIGADVADNPVAFTNFVAGVEQRLVRLYTNEADRTARQLVAAENELSGLAAENRVEVHNGTTNISLYTRSLYAQLRKSADQVLTPSNTTLQNITDLSVAVPGVVGANFMFRGKIFYEASATADIKFAFTFPVTGGASMRWGAIGPATSGGASGDGTFETRTGSGSAIAYGGGGVGTFLMAIIEGEITMGTNAGTLQFQAAQNTSDASTTTLAIRSSLQVWRTA